MDTRFLESLLIFSESGSIAEAARRQNITPAALTQRIRALEAEMGVRLLTRSGQTTRPTLPDRENAAARLPIHGRTGVAADLVLQNGVVWIGLLLVSLKTISFQAPGHRREDPIRGTSDDL